MANIYSIDDLINRVTGGSSGTPQSIFFMKNGRNADGATSDTGGRWSSMWRNYGVPSHGNTPSGAAAAPDNTTAGSLQQASPGGGRQQWLVNVSLAASSISTVMLYDRLLHKGGLSGTVTAAQTVSGSLTRYSSGTTCVGNQIWVEIYTQIGSTGTTVTASYTNQDGNAATTPSVSIGGSGLREARRIIPLSLASGDTGVQAVASVTLAGTTGTAGDFGVTIARPLALVPTGGGAAAGFGNRDLIGGASDGVYGAAASAPGIVEVQSGACLALAIIANAASATEIHGALHLVEA